MAGRPVVGFVIEPRNRHVAEAETVEIVERNMSMADMRGHAVVLPGSKLSRENIMRQSANLHELALPMLLPTITINTTVSDFRPIKQMQMVKIDGQKWELFGEVMSEAR